MFFHLVIEDFVQSSFQNSSGSVIWGGLFEEEERNFWGAFTDSQNNLGLALECATQTHMHALI